MNSMTTSSTFLSDQAEFASYRSSMYRSAASAFALEPTTEQLFALVGAAIDAGQGGFVRDSEGQLLTHMRGYEGADFESLRMKVATEYAELFVGPRPPLAPLYESVYVGMPRRLNTEVTMQVRRCYEEAGFKVVKRNRIPNDHLSFELEFMAELCDREAAALEDFESASDANMAIATEERIEKERSRQLSFLEDHLGAWIDAFCSRLSEAWCADYYDAWARFVQMFVKEDCAYVAYFLV